jgi:glycosyltransferase involved in cell wall biosynthesis
MGAVRVLLVAARYPPSIGGTEIHTREVARRISALGTHVTVVTTSLRHEAPQREPFDDGVRVITVPAWPSRGDYYFAPAIYRVVAQGGWDVVHIQGLHGLMAPITMLAAVRNQIPFFLTFHTGGHSSRLRLALRPFWWRLLRRLVRRSHALFAASEFERQYFARLLDLPQDALHVLPSGVRLPDEKVATGVARDPPLIVSIGRLERYKGHHRVIEALPLVAREVPDIQLRIVGSGPFEATLGELVRDLGLTARVQIGPIPADQRTDLAALLARARLAIFLSDYESQGMAAMEAVAFGCPTLVADGTALHDLAAKGLARPVPPNATAKELAAAIVSELEHPTRPPDFEPPDWETLVEALARLYRQVAQPAEPERGHV